MTWTDAELDTYADVLRQPARAQASSACYRTFLTRELPAALRQGDRSDELRVPSLLVMGGASPLRTVLDPRPGPNLEVVAIEGAGHFLPEEAPDAVRRTPRRSWPRREERQAAQPPPLRSSGRSAAAAVPASGRPSRSRHAPAGGHPPAAQHGRDRPAPRDEQRGARAGRQRHRAGNSMPVTNSSAPSIDRPTQARPTNV